MEAPQMRGVEEPLLPERCAVEGGATQSEGAIETQERRYPRLHKRAGLRGLDVWAEISNSVQRHRPAPPRSSSEASRYGHSTRGPAPPQPRRPKPRPCDIPRGAPASRRLADSCSPE